MWLSETFSANRQLINTIHYGFFIWRKKTKTKTKTKLCITRRNRVKTNSKKYINMAVKILHNDPKQRLRKS